MSFSLFDDNTPGGNPLDTLESIFTGYNWPCSRLDPDSLVIETTGGWSEYQLCFRWLPAWRILAVSCSLELAREGEAGPALYTLLALVNSRTGMGHFEYNSDGGGIVWRHSLPCRGAGTVIGDQISDLIEIALSECEQYYPAFLALMSGDHSPAEALLRLGGVDNGSMAVS